ncbi:hypothetical protein QYE76_032210 [Lolium multiflorum]|uniref:Uncharacterized protein n=1 Tax=Lolium multiflorum TaxID=4521 RepID=A0AAD8VI51_LOLMU|nr:hypothetical protein QYE76_032210 [Lolium multiflorum]
MCLFSGTPPGRGSAPEGFSIDTAAISTAIFINAAAPMRGSSSPSRLRAVPERERKNSSCVLQESHERYHGWSLRPARVEPLPKVPRYRSRVRLAVCGDCFSGTTTGTSTLQYRPGHHRYLHPPPPAITTTPSPSAITTTLSTAGYHRSSSPTPDMEDYMDYFEDDTSASTADVEEHVELDTDYGSASITDMTGNEELDNDYGSGSIIDMTDIEELYNDNCSQGMEDMVEHHHEYDIDSTMNTTDASKVLMHMIIYIELVTWIIKSVPNTIVIDTPLRAQQGAKNNMPRHMSHNLCMPRIVIDTHHLMIVVDHHHLMDPIDIRHHMIIDDTSHPMIAIDQHLPRIFDDTPQAMVMMREDESLNMTATNTIIGCLPLQGWQVHIKRTFLIR